MHEEIDGQAKTRWDYKGIYVEHSTANDAVHIARHLRAADRREVSAITVEPPLQVIRNGILATDPCYTIRISSTGRPCGVFGCRETDHPQSGLVWLVGTDDLLTHSTTFLRHSRKWLAKLHEHYRLLYNVIDARNEVHLNWLEWLGFEFIEELPKYGVERRKFILFRRYV